MHTERERERERGKMFGKSGARAKANTIAPSASMQRIQGKIRDIVRGMGLNGKPALTATAMQGVPSLTRILTGMYVCMYVCFHH